jgi:6-phosphogluconolactonase (cycloisomerase 2 family)
MNYYLEDENIELREEEEINEKKKKISHSFAIYNSYKTRSMAFNNKEELLFCGTYEQEMNHITVYKFLEESSKLEELKKISHRGDCNSLLNFEDHIITGIYLF